MRKKSITLRILFFIFSVFLITAVSVMVLADYQLKKIINKSQDALYVEKLDSILRTLDIKVQKLKATGLREAYEEGFKESALLALRKTHYKSEDLQIYPFIVNLKGEIVLHPAYPPGSKYFPQKEQINNALKLGEGDFLYSHEKGDEDWVIFRKFKEWDWLILYHVPLEIKYAAVNKFRNRFILVMVLITLIALAVLSLMITGAIRPVVKLTEASTAMAGGDLDRHVDTSGDDEIGILARSFTHMRNSIREKIDDLARTNEELRIEIDERRKAEQERERINIELEQKNKELEQVVYVTSHDLRTPLVNIEGFSKELNLSINELIPAIQSGQLTEEVKEKAAAIMKKDIPESLKYISASINKMDLLLTGLLRLSRLGRSELRIEGIDMNRLISEVINIFQSRINKLDIKLEISELPECKGDEIQMNQIFSNLIDNSIKYLDVNNAGIIRISGYREDGRTVYCVEDNGIGFDSEYKEKIFDIFHRLEPANYSGEGLGLTIVQKALERQKGRVWVESEPGKGSKFYISMPGS
jgi:signal transduction histidine kinase